MSKNILILKGDIWVIRYKNPSYRDFRGCFKQKKKQIFDIVDWNNASVLEGQQGEYFEMCLER